MSGEVWYWREGTTQRGPVTWEKLQSMAAAGKIMPNDWVMREGWNDWKLACEANDSGVDAEAVGPPPPPPPLPLLSLGAGIETQYAPQVGPFAAQAPVAMVELPAMESAAMPLPMPVHLPLPPLAPEQIIGDLGPPAPSPDGVSDGDVLQLRRTLRDGPEQAQPAAQWNFAAMAALAASVTGLLFLAFEMGLVGVGLGGWCLYASSATGNNSGKSLALTAVIIGCVNVIFRVMCATMDLGLTHM